MQRASFYIDGYNFYRGLRDKKWTRFYWLDMVKFCSLFLKSHQQLAEVNYFTAIPKDKKKQERFDCFLSANRLNPKFTLLLGKFMEKTVPFGDKLIRTYEEKQTDVHIAVKTPNCQIPSNCQMGTLLAGRESGNDSIPRCIDLSASLKLTTVLAIILQSFLAYG